MTNLRCAKCNRIFDVEREYIKHVFLNRCRKPYQCKSCNYIIRRKSDYKKHLETKKCKENIRGLKRANKFMCDRCGHKFRDNFILSRHLNRKIPCDINLIIKILFYAKHIYS